MTNLPGLESPPSLPENQSNTMEAISTGVNLTAAAGGGDGAPLPLPLDAGSIFVLAATLLVFCAPLLWLFPPFPPRRSDALAETHTRLGLAADSFSSSSSSPAAEFDLRAAAALEAPGAAGGIVRSLFVYPVKSCKGIELARAKVVPTGLEFDRLFTLAQLRSPFPVAAGDNLGPRGGGTAGEQQQHRWEFITQRQFPLLATVEVELWRPDLAKIKGFRDPSAGSSDEVFLVLRFPWRRRVAGGGPLGLLGAAWELLGAKCARGWRAEPQVEVLLPVEYPSRADAARKGYAVEGVRVWGEEVAALNMGSELPPELGLYLGVSNKLALFRVDPEAPREVFKCAPGRDEAGYQPVVGFQDSVSLFVLAVAGWAWTVLEERRACALIGTCFFPLLVSGARHEPGQRARRRGKGGQGRGAEGPQPAAVPRQRLR